jgi:hypothetical protein
MSAGGAADMAMKETPVLDRFATLSVRSGISLGILHASRPADFRLMLAAAARAFAAGRRYAENEVNDVLRDWLAHEGAMLAVDHVELRRWLVDCRALDRDDYGRAYVRGEPAPEIAALIAALTGTDLRALAAAARARDALLREERKRQWTARGEGQTT